MKATWTVVVIYQDKAARETAVDFCDRLVERFWVERGFDVSWWSFELLEQRESSREALEKASRADVIVFALHSEDDLPWSLRAWNETWLGQRGEREGILVGLTDCVETGPLPGREPGALRRLAHRAGMDYLTQVPQSVAQLIPDSPESCSERAQRVTSLLHEILQRRSEPSATR